MNTTDKAAWVTLEQAAEHVGPRRAGRPTQPNTIREWCLKGLAGVRLRSRLRGGVRMTKLREVDRFFRRVERAKLLAKQLQQVQERTPARRRREQERARKRLEDMGAR